MWCALSISTVHGGAGGGGEAGGDGGDGGSDGEGGSDGGSSDGLGDGDGSALAPAWRDKNGYLIERQQARGERSDRYAIMDVTISWMWLSIESHPLSRHLLKHGSRSIRHLQGSLAARVIQVLEERKRLATHDLVRVRVGLRP